MSIVGKIFSKKAHEDDLEFLRRELPKFDENQQISGARTGLIIAIIYFCIALTPYSRYLENTILLCIFYILLSYIWPIMASKKHYTGTIINGFIISMSLCFAGSGIVQGKAAKLKTGIIREDHNVYIFKTQDNKLLIRANKLHIPLPVIDFITDRISK